MPSHQDLCTRRAGWRVVGTIGLSAMLWAVGCFKPAILDGGFRCGPADACPDGMICVADRCYERGSGKIPTDAATDTNDGGPDSDAMCERRTTPPSGCTVQTDLACDPVCQTGCCPDEKCTALNVTPGRTAITLGCSPATPSRKLEETCDASNAGTPMRSDNCEAGLVCVRGDVGAICLKLCRNSDGDCSDGTRCESRKLDAEGTALVSVCGLSPTPCSPSGSTSGCPGQRICYLQDINATDGDRTICDISAGEGGQMASCRYARDCYPGSTCATTGSGVGRCWPTCTAAVATCPGVTHCKNVGKTYGYCD
jgi:hypothetical protein